MAFQEWTSEGKMRAPSFLGLRDDKEPKEVVKENRESRKRQVAPY